MKLKTICGIFLLAASLPVAANELIVTSAKAGTASAVGIDFVNSGEAVAFEALLDVGTSKKGAVNTSKCLARLPKSHTGSCVHVDNKVKIMVYSLSNTKLPAGIVEVGQVSLRSQSKRGGISVIEVVVGNSKGEPLAVKSNSN